MEALFAWLGEYWLFKKCIALFISCFAWAVMPAQAVPSLELQRTLIQQILGPKLNQQCVALPQLRSTTLLDALQQLYQSHAYLPIWSDVERVGQLRHELLELAHDGLNPLEYLDLLTGEQDTQLCAELRYSSQYLLALEHLSRGRLAQQQQEPMWTAPKHLSPVLPSVSELAELGVLQVSSAFNAARSKLPLYQQLRSAYVQMSKDKPVSPVFPDGPTLRPGDTDPRIPELVQRLTIDGYLSTPVDVACTSNQPVPALPESILETSKAAPANTISLIYHPQLQAAVRAFQSAHGLQVDGIVGKQTVAALNITPAERVLQVQINLERLRWLSARRHENVLLVNAAGSTATLYQGNNSIWTSRVQTGSASRATPLLDSQINRVTLNPSWTIPPTIYRQDKLPAIRQNPDYFAQHDLQVLDYQGNQLDPEQIDWKNPPNILLRQPPGPLNPLGRMAFRFDNPFSVYLHDTPSQTLFARAIRNVSSGCVRVEQASSLAEMLFGTLSEQQQERIERLQATGKTHEIRIQDGPQVILGYWTAQADENQQLLFMSDPYALDKSLGTALLAATGLPTTVISGN